MPQNHHLAQAIADQGFVQFFAVLRYKAERYGTQLIAADPWFPSSKLCSTPGCGYLNKALTLKDREWTCPVCGRTHDRDVNAAINLKGLATRTAPLWRQHRRRSARLRSIMQTRTSTQSFGLLILRQRDTIRMRFLLSVIWTTYWSEVERRKP